MAKRVWEGFQLPGRLAVTQALETSENNELKSAFRSLALPLQFPSENINPYLGGGVARYIKGENSVEGSRAFQRAPSRTKRQQM